MADAKKCDRCGMYYTSNTQHKMPHHKKITVARLDIVSKEGKYEKYDLCDGCIHDLFKFMEHGRIEVAE